MLPDLVVLDCNGSGLTEIPKFPDLMVLNCCRTNLKEIPMFPNLVDLWCNGCTSLTKVPVPRKSYICRGCTWLEEENKNFDDNIEKLKRLQRFCRNNLKYWRFKRWVNSREFAEWFYDPEQWGGRASKRNIEKFFSN